LRFDRLRIERQGTLEQANRLTKAVARFWLEPCSTSAKNIVERIRMLVWPGGFRSNQLDIECICDPTGNFVLETEQIIYIEIKALGPQMRISLGIDQLSADAELVA